MSNLTNKEIFLLEGEKYQQKLAIDKYNDYALQSCDNNLKNLFSNLVKVEENHLKMIDEILQGKVPNLSNQPIHPYYENNYTSNNNYLNVNNITLTSMDDNLTYDERDKIICFEALTTEELLHSTYSTSRLEFKNTEFDDALKYIINEKLENLNYLHEYMNKKGMYNNTIYF